MKKFTLLLAVVIAVVFVNAQTAEEIIENYIETIGGQDAWNKVEGLQINAIVNSPMGEIPITIINMRDGKQLVKISLQGTEIVQLAFDGETAWTTNFQSMQAEKTDNETTENIKRQTENFPNALFDYKKHGYQIELLENETFEGTECFKIKLTQTPSLVEGKEVENITYYLLDTENFIPLSVESDIHFGPGKGNTSQTTFSDYQEVDGLYFAFSMQQGVKGTPGQVINIQSIKVNPEINDSIFSFPGSEE